MEELDRFGTLCTTPLLLNLMLSEYLRHEARDSAIQFDGAVAGGTLATPCAVLHDFGNVNSFATPACHQDLVMFSQSTSAASACCPYPRLKI